MTDDRADVTSDPPLADREKDHRDLCDTEHELRRVRSERRPEALLRPAPGGDRVRRAFLAGLAGAARVAAAAASGSR